MSVNKLKAKSLNDIKTVKLKYLDDTITFDKTDYSTSEAFNFSFYDVLDNPNDITTNNYSYFFLSKKGQLSNQISYIQKENEPNAILTTLQFGSYFLYFDSNDAREATFDPNAYVNSAIVHNNAILNRLQISVEDITNYSGYLFIVEFIPGTNKCYIKHISNSQEYYLYNNRIAGTVDEYQLADDSYSSATLAFTTDKNIIKTFGQFTYLLEDDKLVLAFAEPDMINVKPSGSDISIWIHKDKNVDTNNKIKAADDIKDKFYYPVKPTYIGKTFTIVNYIRLRRVYVRNSSKLELTDNNRQLKVLGNYPAITIKRLNNSLNPNVYINSAWLTYNSPMATTIDTDRSAFNQESQYIYHLQYNNIDNKDYSTTVNIIPLKNHVSPGNNIIRGDYINNDLNVTTPNTSFREYTAIETGGMREYGNETITLAYTYYNDEYKINPGTDFIFTIQANDESLSGTNKFSLYPYKQLNINNSQFINNGACGSDIPLLADKVKKFQKNSAIFNNGRYLCTWLYQTPELKQGIWLDRYYYPDRISKKDSYYGTVCLNTDTDIIDKDYIYANGSWNETDNNALGNVLYFDKQSDLVFEPGVTYTYSRIGEDDINAALEKLSNNRINQTVKFNTGDKPISISNERLVDSGVMDLSFDMFINPEKTHGPCILSNSMTNGLSITDTDDITPYIYTFDKTTIYLRNITGEIINSFNLTDFYSDSTDIEMIAVERPFKDIAVITSESVYIFSFDLLAKKRIKNNFLTSETVDNWRNSRYMPVSAIFGDNDLYILISKTITDDTSETPSTYEVSRIIRVDIANEKWNEINRYSLNDSKLAVSSNNKYYPLHSLNISSTNNAVSSKKYPLPLSLANGSSLTNITSNLEYTPEYWYIAPEFKPDMGDVPINNASAIKSIYYKNGKLYAFPFHRLGKIQEDNSLYGIRFRKQGLTQLEFIELAAYEMIKVDTGFTNVALESKDYISEFAVNDRDEFIFVKKLNNKYIVMLFDEAKRLLHSIDLSSLGYTDIFAVDSLKIYNNGVTKSVFAGIAHHTNKSTGEETTQLLLFDINGNITNIILTTDVSVKLPYLINYFSIITNYQKGLKFNLTVETNDKRYAEYTCIFDYTTASMGWHNIKIQIDSENNIFNVYVNNNKLPMIKKSIDLSLINDKHLFDNPFIIGTAKYKRSTTLAEFLKEEGTMYNAKNVKIKNINVYNKILLPSEVQAIELSKSPLSPVIITLPSGQRNNLEEIIRYFKFNPPANMSNTISIDIQHSGITDTNIQKQLSIDILNKIKSELALPITIKEINFI